MKLILTPLADAGVSVLPPDIVWDGTVGDFAIARMPEDGPAGGLVSANPLASAALLLLFTDARAETHELRFEHQGDRRGWPGDGFDVETARGEAPLGSKLWLYRRHELTEVTGMQIEAEANRALEPLKRQGAVASIAAKATVDKVNGQVLLAVALYGRDGREIFNAKFDPLWRRVDGRL